MPRRSLQNAMKSMLPRDGVAAIKKLHVVTATKELHDEENVAKQVASQGRMEFKLNDEAFNKLQKKVIEELVAKLKLLERKISLLSKENSLQSGVIMQLKKYHSTKSKMLQHCDRGHLFARKYMRGTIMLLIIVITKQTTTTISKSTQELVMDE